MLAGRETDDDGIELEGTEVGCEDEGIELLGTDEEGFELEGTDVGCEDEGIEPLGTDDDGTELEGTEGEGTELLG